MTLLFPHLYAIGRPIYPSAYLSTDLPLSTYLFYLPIYQPTYRSTYRSIYQSTYLGTYLNFYVGRSIDNALAQILGDT